MITAERMLLVQRLSELVEVHDVMERWDKDPSGQWEAERASHRARALDAGLLREAIQALSAKSVPDIEVQAVGADVLAALEVATPENVRTIAKAIYAAQQEAMFPLHLRDTWEAGVARSQFYVEAMDAAARGAIKAVLAIQSRASHAGRHG